MRNDYFKINVNCRRCPDCGQILPEDKFYSYPTGKLSTSCKNCMDKGSFIINTKELHEKAEKMVSTGLGVDPFTSWIKYDPSDIYTTIDTSYVSNTKHFVPKYHNCPNCMAPVTNDQCPYCGTRGLYHYE